jgi:hypothetical protein
MVNFKESFLNQHTLLWGMVLLQEKMYAKLNALEKEIEDLKLFVAKKMTKPVSIKNLGKLLVSEKELDTSIEEAKKSLSSS